jgi:tetratricopeptide (TPR) repeat protein
VALREMGEVLLRVGEKHADDYRCAMNFLQESAQLCRSVGDEKNLARTLRKLGEGAQYSGGDHRAARAFFEGSLAIECRRKEPFALAAALHYNGSLSRDSGNFERARSFYQESVQLFRDISKPNV